jgi:Ca-activated chloride channel homolog
MVLSRALRLSVFSFGLGAIHIVAVLAALNLTGCDSEGPPRRADALASRIELAAGNVSVQQAGGAWERAIAGLLLRRGARIKVGPGDRALIRLDDGSAVFMRHSTEVQLHPEGLRLASGEIWIDAPNREDSDPARFQAGDVVVTAARAGLDIHKSARGVQVYVARGLAVVRALGGRTEVQAGQRADVQGARPPRLRPVAFWEDWTGGMADRQLAAGQGGAGSGRIYAIDRSRPGAAARALTIRAQHVRAVIRGGVARTTVDQRFFNPGDRRVEGYYWFTVPEGAAVDRFALEVNGTLMEGEVVERKLAAATYEKAIRTPAVDPALLEWIDGRTFRARIYPIEAHGTRRVVLSYMQLLPTVDGKQHYVYPLGSAVDRKEAARIDDFGLEVDLGEQGKQLKLATTADARVSRGGQRVSMRRSGYTPRGDFLLELQGRGAKPLQAVRVKSTRNEAAYVMLRYTPDLDWASLKKVPGDVVVVVDTSAGGDDTDRQLRAEVAEAILRALSTGDRFALVTADLTPVVIYPVKGRGLAPADEASVGAALDALARVPRGGASDLGAVLNVALKRLHGASQPAVVYIGDGRATVGELSGDQLARRVTRSMVGSSARLFTIGVGASADHSLLGRLARLGGGREFRVDQAEQAV